MKIIGECWVRGRDRSQRGLSACKISTPLDPPNPLIYGSKFNNFRRYYFFLFQPIGEQLLSGYQILACEGSKSSGRTLFKGVDLIISESGGPKYITDQNISQTAYKNLCRLFLLEEF